jgi:antirestriction protein ArdC
LEITVWKAFQFDDSEASYQREGERKEEKEKAKYTLICSTVRCISQFQGLNEEICSRNKKKNTRNKNNIEVKWEILNNFSTNTKRISVLPCNYLNFRNRKFNI